MIRPLEAEDREQVVKILVTCGSFTEEEIKVALELIDIYIIDKSQKDYEIFVDAEDKIVHGYVCIGHRPLTEGTYDLYWIAVDPVTQSKGIGSSLVHFSEEHLKKKGGRLILIETSQKPSYEKERRFYEKNGYTELVTIREFYRPGDSLVMFAKYLTW
jgi:ribosomal protein S18 acetylase RimI-like enzyme